MTLGEMYDLMLPVGTWRYRGYDCRTSQKTHALFEFAVGSAAVLAADDLRVEALDELGRKMGLLYQIGNDYHDWQPKNLLKRHSSSDVWPITFGFPLAVYLQTYGSHDIQLLLRRRLLSYSDWQRLLERIWRPEVETACHEALRNQLSDVLATTRASIDNPKVRGLYEALAELTVQEKFWYDPY
jgi:geranylgeranyl pyrophosphate synthase